VSRSCRGSFERSAVTSSTVAAVRRDGLTRTFDTVLRRDGADRPGGGIVGASDRSVAPFGPDRPSPTGRVFARRTSGCVSGSLGKDRLWDMEAAAWCGRSNLSGKSSTVPKRLSLQLGPGEG